MVLETVTNLPDAVVSKITGPIDASPTADVKSAVQVAAECFPVTAVDAVTASSTGRAKNLTNGAALTPATTATKPRRSAP